MTSRRSFGPSSSLSLVKRGQLSLQDWVNDCISEAILGARSRGAALFHLRTRRLECDIPFEAFDSPIRNAFLFGGPTRLVIGLGVAKLFESKFSTALDSLAIRSAIERDAPTEADASRITLMGGWGFPSAPDSHGSAAWSGFTPSLWVIPALTFTYENGETFLTLTAHVRPSSNEASLRARYQTLAASLEPRSSRGANPEEDTLPQLKRARAIPSQEGWLSRAQAAIDSISRDELKKVVLSRAVSLTFQHMIPASLVLKRLIDFNPDSTIFAVKRNGSVFLGATPEGLLSAKRGDVVVPCLAASSPRDDDGMKDERLGAQLLADAKSRREHQFVVQAAVGALSHMTSSIEVPDAPILKTLTTIHHLYTPIKAKLLDGEHVLAAALALWPNPALAGEPRERAVEWLRRFEGMNRGWFSGVVGIVNGRLDEANLLVGLRSGVIKGERAVIYAGAGLVAGSSSREEFEETNWKLRTMERALGIDNRASSDGR